jgi:predicted transglutaminase-like cysteine proteinase
MVNKNKRGNCPSYFLQILLISVLCTLSLFCVSYAVEFTQSYLDEIGKTYGEYAKRRLISWQKLTTENKNLDEKKKLEAVNLFFNLLQYEKDVDHWGVADHWATPLEFVVSGAGDCEDFAVAKYFALLELGVPDDKLLLMYVKLKEFSNVFNQAHMVLLYYETPTSTPLALDNVNKEILPADQRTDLLPIYGFNGTGLWQAKELGKGNKIGQANDLKRWVDLEERIKSGKISKWKDQ